MTTPTTREIIDNMLASKPSESFELVETALELKALQRLEIEKVVVAKSIFNEGILEEDYPTRKHFQAVADTIKHIEDPEKRKEMAHHHATIFKGQNPRFDHVKFFKAAGIQEEGLEHNVGDHVELHPATDRWMRGDVHGTIHKVGSKLLHVKMHRSGQTIKVHPTNIGKNHGQPPALMEDEK